MKDVTNSAPKRTAKTKEVALLTNKNELSVTDLKGQLTKIHSVMRSVMKPDLHYGTVPGVKRNFLFKPGAEMLALTFRLVPKYSIEKTQHDKGHITYDVTCDLYHQPTGAFVGQGVGACSTLERKYRYRTEVVEDTEVVTPYAWIQAGRPMENLPKILKNNGYTPKTQAVVNKEGLTLTSTKIGKDWRIAYVKKIDNPDIADVYNTALKMAKKRSMVDAVITALAVSDIYTQDPDMVDPDFVEPEEVDGAQTKRGSKAKSDTSSEPEEKPKRAQTTTRRSSRRSSKRA